jgi:outer membrane beta-barrel protein
MQARNTTVNSIAIFAVALLAAFAVGANAQPKAKGAAGKVSPAAGSATSTPAPAPSPTSPGAAKLKDDKVDVSDLENKYWAPKDTDFSVVQNRTYTKEKRWFATLHYGPIINDKYSDGYVPGLSVNYFLSERLGFQATYMKADLHDSNMVTSFREVATGARPDFNRFTDYYGVGVSFVPFYAKMSLMGRKIMYFDMAITPTIGMTGYDQQTDDGNRSQSSMTYGIDITQYFFLKNWFAIRADVKNQWNSEDVLKYRGVTPPDLTGTKVRTESQHHNTFFLLGLTFFY